MVEFIGQALGILAVILGFVSFQMKTPKGILIFQILASAVFAIHYLLIGAITAMALNLNGIKITPHEEFELCRKMWGEPRMGEPLFEDNFISPSGISKIIKSFGINAAAYGIEAGKSYEASVHIEKELQNGRQVIIWSHSSEKLNPNPFSKGEHYILAAGFTQDGKILIANTSDYVAAQNGIQFTDRQTIEKILMDGTRITDYTWGRYNFSDGGSYVVVG